MSSSSKYRLVRTSEDRQRVVQLCPMLKDFVSLTHSANGWVTIKFQRFEKRLRGWAAAADYINELHHTRGLGS